ncbi:MAG: EVE domain-containing protein [Candidatus Sericytochromatia bacterium]|nr:EVE domain-containing protein [Candidatus Sericytochromatia bacterium]
MQSWLIQINPDEVSLSDHLQEIADGLKEPEGEWQLQRYGRQIAAGDQVFFWQSGPEGGLMLTGEWLSAAYQNADQQWYAAYRLHESVQPPLRREECLAAPLLQDLLLLRRPQGQLFTVSEAQSEALKSLLHGRLAPVPENPSLKPFYTLVQKIQRQGLHLSGDLIQRYHLALESSPLVILAGASGLGKSWLTKAYAQASGAEYLLVPVAPNWVAPEDLLGYFNAMQNHFQATAVTCFIRQAAAQWHDARRYQQTPTLFHLMLDEINLARIEFYLALLLSALEVRRRGPAEITLADGSRLLIPDNLRCIGTLNMDASTQPLSARVCDRAQILELSLPERPPEWFAQGPWADCCSQLWEPLQQVAPLSYRSLNDMHSYLQAALAMGLDWESALDQQLVQKVLPQLQQLQPHHARALASLAAVLPERFCLSRQKLQQLQQSLQEMGFAAFFPLA